MATAAVDTTRSVPNALDIPRLTHAEAAQLGAEELDRVLAVLDSLEGDDWSQPTDCTEWRVQEMAAHLAGSCAGYASFGEFARQFIRNPYIRKISPPVDALNHLQVTDRADKAPTDLVDELREAGPKAIRNRARVPWFVRMIRLPFGPPLGFASVGYLLDTIYPRDEWMHRADLCRATGKQMRLTLEHDGRLVALVLRELAHRNRRAGIAGTVDLTLTGDVTLTYRFGDEQEADATIRIDILAFNRLTSERITSAEAESLATISGDAAVARRFLENAVVPY